MQNSIKYNIKIFCLKYIMECPICFEIIKNSCHGSCGHHFCYNCLMRWCKRNETKCPTCRKIMFQIVLDKDYDFINNPFNKEKINKEKTKEIKIIFDDKKEPGITLAKNTNDKNIGIKVLKLERNNKCIEYLKVNQKILYLNGLPCMNLTNSINIIRYAFENSLCLIVELEIKKNKISKKKIDTSFSNKLLSCFNVINIS